MYAIRSYYDFRLPNTVIDAEIDNLRKIGVRFECNTLVGRLFTIAQMRDEMGFDAVFIGTGAGYPSMLRITSYNVCYTKLLRSSNSSNNTFRGGMAELLARECDSRETPIDDIPDHRAQLQVRAPHDGLPRLWSA